jgi:hypothetical protein
MYRFLIVLNTILKEFLRLLNPNRLRKFRRSLVKCIESVAAEMFTQGLNKFVEKRGDINGKIQAQKFQNTWAEHYDPRIFQVDNIANSNIPEADKGTRIKDITSRMTDAEFKKYKEDRTVIHRLSKGLYQ